MTLGTILDSIFRMTNDVMKVGLCSSVCLWPDRV